MTRKIVCEWAENNRFIIASDGQMWPCCYLSNRDYNLKNNPDREKEKSHEGELWKEYDKTRQDQNVFKKNPEEILKGKWFSKTLPESFENDSDQYRICVKFCSKKPFT